LIICAPICFVKQPAARSLPAGYEGPHSHCQPALPSCKLRCKRPSAGQLAATR